MSLFRLIRLPNLFIVALVQALLYFHLLLPAFKQNHIQPRLNTLEFVFLIIATLCTTACGYIINDLYDYEMDLLNRKNKVIVHERISAQFCIWLYIFLGFLGLLFSLYLAFRIGQVYLSGLYVTSFALLFFYTKTLKKRPLIGNLLVALFCAGVAGLVWVAELPSWGELLYQDVQRAWHLQAIIFWYCAFAFFSTMFREIVKDMEDEAGDTAAGCRTLPIVAGQSIAKLLAASMGIVVILLLGFLYFSHTPGFSSRFYLWALLSIVIPLTYALYLLQKAQTPTDFHRISTLIKWVMLAGILLLLL